jgi:hypothetical protein
MAQMLGGRVVCEPFDFNQKSKWKTIASGGSDRGNRAYGGHRAQSLNDVSCFEETALRYKHYISRVQLDFFGPLDSKQAFKGDGQGLPG